MTTHEQQYTKRLVYMERISPTRMNLLLKKEQITLARQGVEALENKRDALLQEFFGLLKSLATFREKLTTSSREAINSLIMASAVDGANHLRSASMVARRDVTIHIKEKKLWGVTVPDVEKVNLSRLFFERGVSPTGTSSRMDVTAAGFERILDLVIEMAPTEIKLKRLGKEIQKTTRRVNTLEQQVIPSLESEVRHIRQTLEERERESIFLLKRLKKRRSGTGE